MYEMIRESIITKIFCAFIAQSIIFMSLYASALSIDLLFPDTIRVINYALADEFSDAAADGNATASDLITNFAFPDLHTDTSTPPDYNNVNNGSTVYAPELFPGMTGNTSSIVSLYGDDISILNQGVTKQSELYTGTDESSKAYQAVFGGIMASSHPDMTNDPIWTASDNVLSGLELSIWDEVFTGCTTTETIVDTGEQLHVPDYKTCERITASLETCLVQRSVSASIQDSCEVGVPLSSKYIYKYGTADGFAVRGACNPWKCDEFGNCSDTTQGFDVNVFGGYATMPTPGSDCGDAWETFVVDMADTSRNIQPVHLYKGFGHWGGGCSPMNVYQGHNYCSGNNCSAQFLFGNTSAVCIEWDGWGMCTAHRVIKPYTLLYETCPDGQVHGDGLQWYGCISNCGDSEWAVYGWIQGDPGFCYVPQPYYDSSCECTKYTYSQGNVSGGVTGWIRNPESISWVITYNYTRPHTYIDLDETITDFPSGCSDPANYQDDSYCSGEWVCTDPDNARVVDMVTVTPSMYGDQLGPLFEGDTGDPICYEAERRYDCTFNQGSMNCYTDVNGDLQCPTNDGTNLDTCSQYENDPTCSFISSSCLEGALDPVSGRCYVYEDIYDCGFNVSSNTYNVSTDVTCSGALRCMGTECITPDDETNKDFTRAVAMLQAVQAMASELNCDGAVCILFTGEGGTCKKAVGGWVDCCESTGAVSLADYIKLYMAAQKLDQQMLVAEKLTSAGLNVQGAWSAIADPVSATWDTVTKPITSAYEQVVQKVLGTTADQVPVLNATGEELATSATVAAAEFVDQLSPELAELIFERGQVWDPVAGDMVEGWTGELVAPLQYIYYAYLIYSIANILVHLIYQCEDEELELTVKRDQKLCHHVGSYCAGEILGMCIEKREAYCCFQSPLARILQEQIRPQIGVSWGDPESPNCEGLDVNLLNTVDWSQVNLNEWIALLQLGNVMPASTIDADILYSLDGIAVDPTSEATPLNTMERLEERTTTETFEQTREKVRQDLYP